MLTAIVLAAGKASRMGTLKQLLPWGEGTILEVVLGAVLACPLVDDEVRVVLGAGRERVEALLEDIADPRLRRVHNPEYQRGMLSSIQRGIQDLPRSSQGFMILLGDQPLIGPGLISEVAGHWLLTRPDFLVPVHRGRRGHPVLVAAKYAGEILALEEAEGGLRNLLRRYPERVLELAIDNPAICIDIDYPEEYRRYRPKGEGE
ncbi:MAG: nucleotidyltransferase family protein [Bacillota bacterium]